MIVVILGIGIRYCVTRLSRQNFHVYCQLPFNHFT